MFALQEVNLFSVTKVTLRFLEVQFNVWLKTLQKVFISKQRFFKSQAWPADMLSSHRALMFDGLFVFCFTKKSFEALRRVQSSFKMAAQISLQKM